MALGVSNPAPRLGDRYELAEVIGQGGMAVVWLAFDTKLQRHVAAKILPTDRFDAVSQQRFYREARHVASLSHPNIVRIFDFGSQDERSFIIMEYVRGASLRSILSSRSTLSVAETCRVGVDALSALDHAHGKGIIHRDVKPGNLLVDVDGRVKVTDFGISRAFEETSEITQGGTFLGTVGYASPEQLAGDAVHARSDLYSLGCVLYQCLTGRPPFESDDPDRLALQHRFGETPVVSDVQRVIPAEVARSIARSLAKSPHDRPSSARDMSSDLLPFAASDLAASVKGSSDARPGGDGATEAESRQEVVGQFEDSR